MARTTRQASRSAAICESAGGLLHLLAVLGQDLTGCTMQGYTDGSCEKGKELDALEGTVTRTGTAPLRVSRQTAAAQLWRGRLADEVKRLAAAADLLMQYGVCSAASAERYSDGMLDAMLQDMEAVQRICYAAADITIPAGGTVCIEAVSANRTTLISLDFITKWLTVGVMTSSEALDIQNQTRPGYARSGYKSTGRTPGFWWTGEAPFRCPRSGALLSQLDSRDLVRAHNSRTTGLMSRVSPS